MKQDDLQRHIVSVLARQDNQTSNEIAKWIESDTGERPLVGSLFKALIELMDIGMIKRVIYEDIERPCYRLIIK